MQVVNATHARKNLCKLMRDVNSTHTPIHIVGKTDDCILISAEDWQSILETQYVNAFPCVVENVVEGSK